MLSLALPAAVAVFVPAAGIAASASVGVMMALGTALAVRAMAAGYPHARLGLCNLVTLGRLALAALLAVPLAMPGGLAGRPAMAWSLVALTGVSLALDGLDGILARRSGLASAFGARFDMEVDAALAAMLAALALASGKAGAWVLALGFMRYGFVAAMVVLPWLRKPLPDRYSRKAACVVQIGVLIALLAPPVAPPLSVGLGLAALAALTWSFAVDVRWLWRNRP
jgi:phosphatidylglycerophosphate synthase